mgnify:CR=1 FL=1
MGAGRAAATLRPRVDYFDALRGALAQLRGLPLSYSLSGLETTDDADWCQRMLDALDAAARDGVPVAERVLYSNGAGFAQAHGDALVDAFARFNLSWVELSRHHPDAARNQTIMRFRPGEPIALPRESSPTSERTPAGLGDGYGSGPGGAGTAFGHFGAQGALVAALPGPVQAQRFVQPFLRPERAAARAVLQVN